MEKRIAFFGPFNKRSALYFALVFAAQLFVYLVPTIFMPMVRMHDIALPVDALIPFWPAFVIPYVLVFFEWGYCYLLAPLLERERFARYTAALLVGFAACFAVYMFYPTTYTRPEIEGGGFFAKLMEQIFGIDQPSRCMPSLHCFLGWLNWRFVHKQTAVPKWLRAVALFFALVTLPTTLLVKQHVLVDVPTGVLTAELAWFVGGHKKISGFFVGIFERIAAKLKVNEAR